MQDAALWIAWATVAVLVIMTVDQYRRSKSHR